MNTVPVSKTKIETKLAIIRESLTELEELSTVKKNAFTADRHNFAIAEHFLRRALVRISHRK